MQTTSPNSNVMISTEVNFLTIIFTKYERNFRLIFDRFYVLLTLNFCFFFAMNFKYFWVSIEGFFYKQVQM